MAHDVNKAMFTGYLEAAPVLTAAHNGDLVTTFLLASHRADRGIEWITCVAWRRLAELLHRHGQAGSRLYVEGRVQTRQWVDGDGHEQAAVEVHLRDIIFLGGDRSRRGTRRSSGASPTDDVPFGFGRDDDSPANLS